MTQEPRNTQEAIDYAKKYGVGGLLSIESLRVLIAAAESHLASLATDESDRLEREKPIDEEWLRSIGFEWYDPDGCYLLDDSPSVKAWLSAEDDNASEWQVQDCLIPTPRGRGQLLDMLRSVGVVVKP